MEKRTLGRSAAALVDQPAETAADATHPRLKDDALWQAAERIVASRGFIKSRFLSRFLLYICEKHLLDRASEITEQQIGEQVFDRPLGYRPGDDNIVRNYARLLRQRLDEYFASEGKGETIRIIVPRGGYVPLFTENNALAADREAAAALEASASEIALPQEAPLIAKPKTAPGAVPFGLWGLSAVLAIALCVSLAFNLHTKPRQTLNDRFWSVFFSSSRDTMVVPADSGLVLYEDLTNRSIHLADYVNGEYQRATPSQPNLPAAVVNELGQRRYTSVVDMQLVSRISQLPSIQQGRLKVRYAREATLDDLKQSNVILLGSFESNPWVELYQKQLDFRFEPRPPRGNIIIHNQHPQRGEQEFYETDESDTVRHTYGLVASMPNLDGTGHVLLVEGINMAGTEAAAEYLFGDDSLPLLRQVLDSSGDLKPFEVLLETSNIGANAPHPVVVTQRIGSKPEKQ